MGLALGRSVGEVRALPAPEYRRWFLFSLIEPWGWADAEYRTGAALAMQYNNHRGEAAGKEVNAFMRDMAGEIVKRLQAPVIPEKFTEDERQAVIAQIKADFGIT